MTKPKFTPGPWKVGVPPSHLGEGAVVEAMGPLTMSPLVARCHVVDAALIAAAPEMYAALEFINELIDDEILVRHALKNDAVSGNKTLRANALLVTALAKARGES